MSMNSRRGGKRVGKFASSSPFGLFGLQRLLLPAVASALVLPGFFWPNYGYVERNDSGFHYRDYKGSPYDQVRTPDPAINQIQCPPPQRPHCGDR